jgi:hypothetical protein
MEAMTLRRALFIAAVIVPTAAGPVTAQFAPGPQQVPPCVKDFIKLRNDAEAKAKAIRVANAHKANVKVACHLFNEFSAAEERLIKYSDANATWCGIPPQAIKSMKQAHAKTNEIRTKVCQIAAAPPRSAGPTLSDALSAPVPDANNIKAGRGGTFDTLTGSPLGTR